MPAADSGFADDIGKLLASPFPIGLVVFGRQKVAYTDHHFSIQGMENITSL